MKYTTRCSGTKIGDVLAEQGRRQDWLAGQLGVAPATVNRWIRGTRTIDLATAKRVAEILDTDLFLLVNVPEGTDDEREDSEAA